MRSPSRLALTQSWVTNLCGFGWIREGTSWLCFAFPSLPLRNANPRRSVQFSSRLLYSTCRCLAAERLPCCAARNHVVLARIRLGPRSEDRTPANPQPSTLRRRRRRSRKRRRPRPRARSRPRRLRLRPQPQLTPPQRCVGAYEGNNVDSQITGRIYNIITWNRAGFYCG